MYCINTSNTILYRLRKVIRVCLLCVGLLKLRSKEPERRKPDESLLQAKIYVWPSLYDKKERPGWSGEIIMPICTRWDTLLKRLFAILKPQKNIIKSIYTERNWKETSVYSNCQSKSVLPDILRILKIMEDSNTDIDKLSMIALFRTRKALRT